MKTAKLLVSVMLLSALVMTSCNETPYMSAPGNNRFNLDSIPVLIPDTSGTEVTVTEALQIAASLAEGQESGEVYKISGTVSRVKTSLSDIPLKYTQVVFYMADGTGSGELQCYNMGNVNNRLFYKASDVPGANSKVTVRGTLTKYNGEAELKNGFIVRIDEFVPAQ